MRKFFSHVARRQKLRHPNKAGAQLVLLFDGAFISAPLSDREQLAATL
ncbi:MAG TPA: hypothetical protein VF776_04900 [Sphingomicrobium sp.]